MDVMLMNKSYRIGYQFQNRVKKYLNTKGWHVITQPKSAFPDHLCWKWDGALLETTIHNPRYSYEIIFVECKVAKYLSKEEKERAVKILNEKQCSNFYVAYRKKYSRKIYFYEFFKNKSTKEVEL